jgi:hypothetical protein
LHKSQVGRSLKSTLRHAIVTYETDYIPLSDSQARVYRDIPILATYIASGIVGGCGVESDTATTIDVILVILAFVPSADSRV